MNNQSVIQGLAILFFFSAFALNNASGQVFWMETFADPASTTSWISGGTNAGPEVWTFTTDPLAGYDDPNLPVFAAPTVSDGYFYFNSDANGGNNPHDVTLTGAGNPADCSGQNDVHFRFYTQYTKANSAAVAYVGVSTDGLNFTDHEVFANAQAGDVVTGFFELALPEANNQAQVWLRFRWMGDWEYHWKVDDLELFNIPGPVPCAANPMAITCDNLDSYDTALKTGPQASWWTTWSGIEGGDEDGIVSTEQASTAPNSMKIVSTDTSGGPQNVLLDLGNKTTGRYELKWKMYIPAGKNSHYNVQQSVPIGGAGDSNLQVFFDNNNRGRIMDGANAVQLAAFKYQPDTWVECRHVFDLDNNVATYYIADTFVTKKAYLRNLGGINFSGANNISTFYLDDVEYIELPPVVYNVDDCDGAVDLALYFGQAPGIPQITGLYDNTNATAAASDPAVTCWGEDINNTPNDVVNNSLWYTFIGDGKTYHIETVPCNASNYIDDGDTQMLIFAGDHCSDMNPILCNDDLYINGVPDYRSGVDLETTNGQNYYMLIDGFESNNVLATGEFCIAITQLPSITCADAAVGDYMLLNNGIVCFGQNLNQIIDIDPNSFVIPNFGPIYGMVWSITTEPIPANTWPGIIPGISSSLVSPIIDVVSAVNNGTGLQAGQYYLTASVVAGGVLINPGATERSINVDPSGGCFFNGPSLPVSFIPNLAALNANATFTQPAGGNDGAINLAVTGGLADPPGNPSALTYAWTGPNGFTATTQNISGLIAGTYTVTITDPSGCVAPFTASYMLSVVEVSDPASVKTLSIGPNPTSGSLLLNLELAADADVHIDVLNTLGQVIQTIDAGKISTLSRSIDLSNQAKGSYLLRLTVGQDIVLRRIVLH